MKELLEKTGAYRVEVCNDSLKAIETARNFKPDAILMDMLMPGKNGFEVALSLKKHPETRSLPVIFLSSFLKDEIDSHHREMMGRDMAFVSKTEDFNTIVETIENSILTANERRKSEKKQTVRIVTYLPREHVDFLDKMGKDVLFSSGFKLSRSELLKQLVEFLQKANIDITDLGLDHKELSDALIEFFKLDA